MDKSPPYEWHSKTQGTGEWEELLSPIPSSYYAINAPAGQTFDKCSDTEDDDTLITQQGSFTVIAAPGMMHPRGYRWAIGDCVTYVRSSVPLFVYWLR